MNGLVLVRGGGDLASGVVLRLHHAGFSVVVTELPRPLAVRRLVCFSEAVYEGQTAVEDVTAHLVTPDRIDETLAQREIPVLVDPNADILRNPALSHGDASRIGAEGTQYEVVIDARLLKSPPKPLPTPVPLHIGLGPGFSAPRDCQAVVETRRGHTLGRVYWIGTSAPDTGQPDGDARRVLRAPVDGFLVARAKIGEHVGEGQVIAKIRDTREREVGAVVSPFAGVLRGLLRDGMEVRRGLKLGDVDARDDPSVCRLVSDKSLAVGGGVLEAVMTRIASRAG